MLLTLSFLQQGCATLLTDLMIRAIVLPSDWALRDNTVPKPPAKRETEETKRLKKDWIIAPTTERYSFFVF
jgi:hypothetical protein